MQPMLKAAGIGQLRYGGGSYADYCDWRTNKNIGKCLPGDAAASFTAGTLRTWSYGAGTPRVVTGITAAASMASGVRLPAESMTVLGTQ